MPEHMGKMAWWNTRDILGYMSPTLAQSIMVGYFRCGQLTNIVKGLGLVIAMTSPLKFLLHPQNYLDEQLSLKLVI